MHDNSQPTGCKTRSPDRLARHFNQIDLSRRWNVSPRTLERWRWLKQGPEYLKIGGHVVYRLEDIERYEAGQIKNPPVLTHGVGEQTSSKEDA
jgi:hypothetical protein